MPWGILQEFSKRTLRNENSGHKCKILYIMYMDIYCCFRCFIVILLIIFVLQLSLPFNLNLMRTLDINVRFCTSCTGIFIAVIVVLSLFYRSFLFCSYRYCLT